MHLELTESERNEAILYALGDAPPELGRTIENRARLDPDFAVVLQLMRISVPRVTSRTTRVRRILTGRCAFAGVLTVLAMTVFIGAHKVLTSEPLLRDRFEGKVLDTERWVRLRDVAVVEDGCLRLDNRGTIMTARDFPGPISLSLRWRWRDLTAGQETYADTLSISLRTSGRQDPVHSYEVLDGVRVTIRGQRTGGQIGIRWPTIWPRDVHLPDAGIPVRPDVWYSLRITDDGDTITVYIAGPDIDPKYEREPILTARPTGTWEGHRIAIYNREHVADVPHESFIDNVVVDQLR